MPTDTSALRDRSAPGRPTVGKGWRMNDKLVMQEITSSGRIWITGTQSALNFFMPPAARLV